MIDDLINELERYDRDDWRKISTEEHYFVQYLDYTKDQLLNICENDLYKYINLELLLTKIYIFGLDFRDHQLALSRIDRLVNLTQKYNFKSLEFKILSQKLLILHFNHRKEEVKQLAEYLRNTYYNMGCEEIKAQINKFISLGSDSGIEFIEHQLKALEFYQNQNNSEEGFIYKNLAFTNLELGKLEKSLYYLRKYLKLSPIMEQPMSYTNIVVSGYLELLQEMGIVYPDRYETIRDELVERIVV